MPLAALIIAEDEGGGEFSSVALLPILGVPLVEYQARLAISCGATHLIILTKQLPAVIVAAIDRLRASGTNVVLARSASEAADAVHPDEIILLFALGCIAETALLKQILATEKPVVVTEKLLPRALDQELIDAEDGWAGLAKIDGGLVRQTAAVLGDWALAPTLLRLAVQAGAARINAHDGGRNRAVRIKTAAQAQAAGSASVAARSGPRLLRPAASRVAGLIAQTKLPAAYLLPVPIMIMATSMICALLGWRMTGLGLACLVPLMGSTAQALADGALDSSKMLKWFWKTQSWATRIVIVAVSALPLNWLNIAIALWLVWMLWDGELQQNSSWHIDDLGAAIVVLIGFAAGAPLAGLVAALALSLAGRIGARWKLRKA